MPSKDWQERVGADEAERHKQAAALIVEVQRKKTEKYGNGRAFHRKQILALKGELTVAADALPPSTRQGLFATPKKYETWIRLSNGSMNVDKDKRPDIRGFGIRVRRRERRGSALGGACVAQDFVLINQETFGFCEQRAVCRSRVGRGKKPALHVPLFFHQEARFFRRSRAREKIVGVRRAPVRRICQREFFQCRTDRLRALRHARANRAAGTRGQSIGRK